MAAALLESAAVIRPPPAVGPSPAVKAAALAAPAPKRRHISSRFAGLRAVTLLSRAGLMRARATVIFRRGVVCEARNTAVNVQDVTKDTWQALVLESDLPVLVEFWAPWCGPCRMIHPVIGELSKEYSGKLKCFQLNTDQSPDIATQYGIRSIPTVMLFKGGEKKDAVIGAVPKSTLVSSIDKFL